MNKTIYSILSLLFVLLLWGCAQEDILQDETQITEEGSVLVKFSAEIPAYNTIQTRANGGVNSMYLLVFDENGIFITLEKANLTNQTDAGGVFTAKLPSSTNKRTVHFICNYDDELRSVQMAGSNEAGIVAQLSTDKATFWARRELENGINATSFSSNPIALLRNQAKISVKNDTEDDNNFEINGFAIHNRPNKGTIAPFSSSGRFDVGAINEPAGLKLIAAVESDINSTEPEKLLFERRNRGASDITTVIIKAKYYDKPYFYKIDLIYKDNNTIQSYNIERNYHYVVRVQSVMAAGYDSFSDALEGASNNNAALDPIIEKYPIISDGTSKLEVEKTLIIATTPGEAISVGANFYPNVDSNVFDNSEVTVTLVDDEGEPSINSLEYNKTTGTITAKASNKEGANLVSLIQVRKGSLARTIRVILRTPFSFDPITINDRNPGVVWNIQSFSTQLRFKIPADFPEELFPLPIKIYTQGLYPAESGLKLEVTNSGEMYYIYNATGTGEQVIDFKTNKSGNKETIRLVADYFVDGAINYDILRYNGTISYGNNTFVPKGAVVISSTGEIEVAANGKYTYIPSGGSDDDTPVTLTYYVATNNNSNGGVQQSFENGHQITTTVGALNNKTVNLSLDHYRITGRMEYSRFNFDIPVNANLDVSNNVSSYRILETGRYELITKGVLNDDVNITIGYRSLRDYQALKNILTLKTDQFYQLR